MTSPDPIDTRAQSYRRDIRALDTQIADLQNQLADARTKPHRNGTIQRLQTELTRAKAQREVKQRLLASLFTPLLFDPVTNEPRQAA